MEFMLGIVVVGAVLFLIFIKKKTDDFNKQTRMPFFEWLELYSKSDALIKKGLSRAFILQTFHLAVDLGALSADKKDELSKSSMKEDPVRMFEEWLDMAFSTVREVFGENEIRVSEARMIGVLMLVALSGVNPHRDLQNFLQKFS